MELDEALRQFTTVESGEVACGVLGRGNINDTWLVRAPDRAFVLQRLNRLVFPHPHLIMANLAVFSRHLQGTDKPCGQRWENSTLVPTSAGAPFYVDSRGDTWRATSYVEHTVTHPAITTSERARQVGWALGRFHGLLADLPAAALHDTLPGFHVLPRYLEQFDRVVDRVALKGSPDLRFCLAFVARRRAGADLLERARRQATVTTRVVHGDPKAANVLFDTKTDLAVSLIDLDTVGPGLLLADIGDCLRSCCNTGGEESGDLSAVDFDTQMGREILVGYGSQAGALFSEGDRRLLFAAVRLIAFELGLRFLTDHLAGNRYFRVSHPEENLHRALVQFHLVARIERQRKEIEGIIEELARCPDR